jgi:hypothetical protein
MVDDVPAPRAGPGAGAADAGGRQPLVDDVEVIARCHLPGLRLLLGEADGQPQQQHRQLDDQALRQQFSIHLLLL